MAAPQLVTGRDCDLTVGANSYANVIASFALEFSMETPEYATLGGTWALAGSETGTLSIQFAYDTAESMSLFTDLWTAADAGSLVSYVATVGSKTFTGQAVAARPGASADAGEVSEVNVTLTLSGIPTVGDTPAAKSGTSGTSGTSSTNP